MLPPDTEALWHFLREQPLLGGFILIGGTALALHLQHRVSEDLDFVWIGSELPRDQLDALRDLASRHAFTFARSDNQGAYEEFLIAGMDLHDSMQNFVVNDRTKVGFFTADTQLATVFRTGRVPEMGGGPRVATVDEIFRSKCLVSAHRSKTRDWFDLFVLMRDHGYTVRDYRQAFIDAGQPLACANGLRRLSSGLPDIRDEGFHALLPHPPSVEEMRDFFRQRRDELELELIAERLRQPPPAA